MKAVDFKIRDPHPSDLNFITSSFLKSMKKESSLGRACSIRVFFKEFNEVIDYILSISTILIACEKENENAILGYILYQNKTIHYAYVKSGMRRFQITKDLIAHAFPGETALQYSQTTNSSKLIAKKYPELIFNPFCLYRKLSNENAA